MASRVSRIVRGAALAGALAGSAAAGSEQEAEALWTHQGLASLRGAATRAKADGQRLLLGLSGGDH